MLEERRAKGKTYSQSEAIILMLSEAYKCRFLCTLEIDAIKDIIELKLVKAERLPDE